MLHGIAAATAVNNAPSTNPVTSGAVAAIPSERPILAVGADLKNAITLVVDGQAFVSQHIGDLGHYESLRAFQETIQDLISMYEVRPEELLVASLSQCHMLWFLHLCSAAGVVVTSYRDQPIGTMTETEYGGGHFTEIALRPEVGFAEPAQAARATELHKRAHELCFIANSVNFPVRCDPV